MKRFKDAWAKIGTMFFVVLALCCVTRLYTASAEETKKYDAELIGIKEFYNMGIDATMKGGSSGTIYPGEKFIVLDVVNTDSGRKYHVHAINANKKGYVSEKYIKLVEKPEVEKEEVVTEVGKKVSYSKANDIYHNVKNVVTYSDGKVSEIPACEKHSFRSGKCEKCSVAQVSDEVGNYVAKQKATVYEKTESKSAKIKTIASGTKVVIAEVKVNKYNNYWGKLADGSGYIWMGNLKKDETAEKTAIIQYDAELTGIKEYYNMGKTASMTGASAGTIYPGEKFIILGKENTSSGVKYYVQAINANKKGYVSEKYVKLVEKGLKDIKEYYKTSCDESHKKYSTKTYTDGTEKTSYITEKHTFKDGKCSLCGAKKVSKVKGEYITTTKVQVYYGTISASTKVKKINKGEIIQISEVTTNIYGNYWGKLADGSGNVWMGNLEKQRDFADEMALFAIEQQNGFKKTYVDEKQKGFSWKKLSGRDTKEWCADFVTWCAQNIGVSEDVIAWTGKALCDNLVKDILTKGGEYHHADGTGYIPRVGDIICYSSTIERAQDMKFRHVGLVVSVDEETFTFCSVEGNTTVEGFTKYNDKGESIGPYGIGLKKREYNKRYKYVDKNFYLAGFVTPNYE